MEATRFTLSIEDIEDQVAILRRQASDKEFSAKALQAEAEQLRAKAERLNDLKSLTVEIGTPISTGRSKVNRKNQIADYLIASGPQQRKTIIEKTGIPEGTVNSEMRDKEAFMEVPGTTSWDVTPAMRSARTAVLQDAARDSTGDRDTEQDEIWINERQNVDKDTTKW